MIAGPCLLTSRVQVKHIYGEAEEQMCWQRWMESFCVPFHSLILVLLALEIFCVRIWGELAAPETLLGCKAYSVISMQSLILPKKKKKAILSDNTQRILSIVKNTFPVFLSSCWEIKLWLEWSLSFVPVFALLNYWFYLFIYQFT